MRKPLIAGNWKMNKTPGETKKLIQELAHRVHGERVQVVVCPPSVCLAAAQEALLGSEIMLGAQNMYFEDSGAYTGEASADMLKELGVEYVILGHSERRQYFAETDETVNNKVKKALQKGIRPIVCVGERLEEKDIGITQEVVCLQVKAALAGLLKTDIPNIVVAYEPVWAIGTGRTATAQEANCTIRDIRRAIASVYGEAADDVRILYGGSMNAGNASELMAQSDIDGGLIGGASLVADSFLKIIHY
jgi:triosephosphate isomerase